MYFGEEMIGQKKLSDPPIRVLYHDSFAESQVGHFLGLVPRALLDASGVVLDIGGGCGFFAARLRDRGGSRVRVVDSDQQSVTACRAISLDAELGDALEPARHGDEIVVCFNLILHHLVGADEAGTASLQRLALSRWIGQARALFINEYVYESCFGNVSGRLIFGSTRSSVLSAMASLVGRFIPSLRANTLGVGVRFRSPGEWLSLFEEAGFRVAGAMDGADEPVSWARRLLLFGALEETAFFCSHSMKMRT